MSDAVFPAVVERLQQAWNAHEVEAVVACFHPNYESIHPFHPERNFRGVADVRNCWQATFDGVPDFRAELCRYALHAGTVWTEWNWYGTHVSGTSFRAGGVMLFGVQDEWISWARVYTETFQCVGPNFDSILADILGRETPQPIHWPPSALTCHDAMITSLCFADLNGTRLYCQTAGAGYPLVFLHGFSLDTRMWQAQWEVFAQHNRVIGYDLRGFGQSSLPTGGPYRHTDDLKALLGHLGLVCADIVGLSKGGGIALDFALEHPDRVRALVLVDATLGSYVFSQDWERQIRGVWEAAHTVGIEAAKAAWKAHPLFKPNHQNPAACHFLRIVEDCSGRHSSGHDSEQAPFVPALQRLADIHNPTLIIVGELEMRDFLDMAEVLERRIPGAHKVTLPSVGHTSSMEAPELFNDVVLKFLSAL